MSDRIERYGQWSGTIAENISFGEDNAKDIIMQLMVDDGVSSRGHRNNIMSDNRITGIAYGKHAEYDHLAVFNYAGSISGEGG